MLLVHGFVCNRGVWNHWLQRLVALDVAGATLCERTYYSVGGGFIVTDEVAADGARQKVIAPDATVLPMPFTTGEQLLAQCRARRMSIAQVMRRNEQHWRSDGEIDAGLERIWQVMQACVARGCASEGVLPGGFKVKRRAWVERVMALYGDDPRALADLL